MKHIISMYFRVYNRKVNHFVHFLIQRVMYKLQIFNTLICYNYNMWPIITGKQHSGEVDV